MKKNKKQEKKIKLSGLKGGQKVKVVEAEPIKRTKSEELEKAKKIKKPKSQGKRFLTAKKKVDPKKFYPIKEAIKLVKETSVSKFVGKLEAHLVVSKIGELGELKLPYFQAQEKRVAIADEKILNQIKNGKIDFDILLASSKFMPELLPFAKILGPKGLMPNPKNGTLVKNPEKALTKFKNAGLKIKTEKNAPVVHLVLGKLDQKDEELIANVQALIKTLDPKNIKKLVLVATMGPGVKVKV